MLELIILFTFLGSIASLFGSFFLLLRRELTETFAGNLLNFAAGVLIGVAFLDLLPEAAALSGEADAFLPALVGFLACFFLERWINVFHHHHQHGPAPATLLILIGDGIHNFIDGVAITAAFLTNTPLGISTSIAIAAHEIPQEIADMGILLAGGWSKTRALVFNFISALASLAGALLAYAFADFVEANEYVFLSLAAGFFIYISASDLIPELHERAKEDRAAYQVAFLILGVVAVFVFTRLLEA